LFTTVYCPIAWNNAADLFAVGAGGEIPFHHVITLAKYYGVSLDYIAEITDTKKTNGAKL